MRGKLIFFLIIALSALLRLAYLAKVPPGLNWDEASVGWNAYSLAKTGSDEYGVHLPLSIRSFNDYKPPLYTYSTAALMALFGPTEATVRATSALAGILTVLMIFLFVRATALGDGANRRLAYLSALMLAISPWHIQFSRIAFEASLALLFFLFGVTCLVSYLHRPQNRRAALAAVGFVLSAYSHHSVKIFLPLFLLGFGFLYRRQIFQFASKLLPAILLATILFLPLLRNMLYSSGQASRALTVSIFAPPNQFHFQGKPLPQVLLENYFSYFDPRFLFFGQGDSPRHHAPDAGVLLLVSAPFILAGLIYLLASRPKYSGLLLFWFALSSLPAIVAIDNPHASRSFLYIPVYAILTALGILALSRRSRLRLASFSFFFVLNLVYYFHQYYLVLAKVDSPAWQGGYKELVHKVNHLAPTYQKIYISTAYDQPYIYFLFFGEVNPLQKNDGTFSEHLGQISFVNFKNWSEADWQNAHSSDLLVLTPLDPKSSLKTLGQIDFPDGKVAFRLAKRE